MSKSTHNARCLLAASCLSLFAAPPARALDIITNGGFEEGGGSTANWTLASLGGSAWYLQSGALAPVNAFTVPLPPEGTYAAMADGGSPGTAALLQPFTVPADALNLTLSFEYYVLNPNSASGTYTIPSPDSLDWTGDPVQQARVDILTQSASLFDVSPVGSGGGLVANVYQTQPGDSNGTGNSPSYLAFSMDITSDVTPGSSYQLRFAVANNLGPLVFGIDDLQIVSSASGGGNPTIPEPGTALLVAGGLLALAGWKRGRQSRR